MTDSALVTTDRVLTEYPDRAVIRGLRGSIREESGRLEQARGDYDFYVERRPGLVQGYTARARVEAKLGECAAALSDLAEAESKEPENPAFVLNRVAYTLAASIAFDCPGSFDPARAESLAQRAAALQPDDGDVLSTLGIAQCQAGDFTSAIGTLHKAFLLQAETSASIAYWLSIAYGRDGKLAPARQWYSRARALEATKAPSFELGRFRAEAGSRLGISPTP